MRLMVPISLDTALQDAKLIDAQLSFSKALDLFIKANQEEMDQYFNGMADYKEVSQPILNPIVSLQSQLNAC